MYFCIISANFIRNLNFPFTSVHLAVGDTRSNDQIIWHMYDLIE